MTNGKIADENGNMALTKEIKDWAHQQPGWPNFTCDMESHKIVPVLQSLEKSIKDWLNIKNSVQILKTLHGFSDQTEIMFITENVIKSSQIEGEYPDRSDVQESIMRNLSNRDLTHRGAWDGMVQMVLDACRNHQRRLTATRLFSWHHGMFPEGKGGEGHKIKVGNWRQGPVRIGKKNKEGEIAEIVYEAPAESLVQHMMVEFMDWFEAEDGTNPFVKVALCHLRFEQIHPFEDGNGRIGRALCDLLLARINWKFNNESTEPFHCLSLKLEEESDSYYELLNKFAAYPSLDVTDWVAWFLGVLNRSVSDAIRFQHSMQKKIALMTWMQNSLNARQRRVVYQMVRWDEAVLTNSKYRKMTGCKSIDASRDLKKLKDKGFLIVLDSAEAGRSVKYRLVTWDEVYSNNAGRNNGVVLPMLVSATLPSANSDKEEFEIAKALFSEK